MKSPLGTLAISSAAAAAAAAACCCASGASAFVVSPHNTVAGINRCRPSSSSSSSSTTSTQVYSSIPKLPDNKRGDPDVDGWAVIRPNELEGVWDRSLGGVENTCESALVVTGTVGKSGDDAAISGLVRFDQMTEVADADIDAAMTKMGASLVCSGMGQELYKDPGLSTKLEVTLCPTDAVVKALSSVPNAAALSGAKTISINFLGGGDLIADEVVDATNLLVQNMAEAVGPKTKIRFNAVSYKDVPDGSASVTVIAVGDGSDGTSSLEKALGNGEAYFYQGKWYAALEGDKQRK